MHDGALGHDPSRRSLPRLGEEVDLKGIGVALVLGRAVLVFVDILKRDSLDVGS